MRRWRSLSIVAASAIVGVVLVFILRPAAGQTPTSQIPRTIDGKANLNGIWQAMNTANWDLQTHGARPAQVLVDNPVGNQVPGAAALALGAMGGVPGGMGVVVGEEIPYQPWAAAKKKENFENALTRDPEVKCFTPGIPRATYMPYPFQIIQGTDKIMMIYEFASANRAIHFDTVAPPPAEMWMGHSVASWDGDTLVVDVTSQVEQTWFDRAGNFHSDELHVIERFTPISPDRMVYEATIEDPKVFTRPWTIRMPLYRRAEEDAQLFEYKCAEYVEELLYGHLRKQQLVTRWEGDFGELGGRLIIDVTRRPTEMSP